MILEVNTKTPVAFYEIEPKDADLLNTPVALGAAGVSDIMSTPVSCNLESDGNGVPEFFTPKLSNNGYRNSAVILAEPRFDHTPVDTRFDARPQCVGDLNQFNQISTATFTEYPQVVILKDELGPDERVGDEPVTFWKPSSWSRNLKLVLVGLLFLLIIAAITGIVLSHTLNKSSLSILNSTLAPTPTTLIPAPKPTNLVRSAKNLIVNGGFSNINCNLTCRTSDTSLIAPWTFTSSLEAYVIHNLTTYGFDTSSFALSLNYLNDSEPLVVQQLVSTIDGDIYEVRYGLSQSEGLFPPIKTGFVVATGGTNQSFLIGNGITELFNTYQLRATSSRTIVTFGSTTYNEAGPAIFNISMVAL